MKINKLNNLPVESGGHLYMHCMKFYNSGSNFVSIWVNYICDKSDAFTLETLKSYIKTKYPDGTTNNPWLVGGGEFTSSGFTKILYALQMFYAKNEDIVCLYMFGRAMNNWSDVNIYNSEVPSKTVITDRVEQLM